MTAMLDAMREVIDARTFTHMTLHNGDPHEHVNASAGYRDRAVAANMVAIAPIIFRAGDWEQSERGIFNVSRFEFEECAAPVQVSHAAIWRSGDSALAVAIWVDNRCAPVFMSKGTRLIFMPRYVRITWPGACYA